MQIYEKSGSTKKGPTATLLQVLEFSGDPKETPDLLKMFYHHSSRWEALYFLFWPSEREGH